MPLLVLHVAGDIPGLPGLFMAGVFSGSLRFAISTPQALPGFHFSLCSTISTGLNALAAIALRDFMPAKMRESMSDKRQVSCIIQLCETPIPLLAGFPHQDICSLLWSSHLWRHLCHQVDQGLTFTSFGKHNIILQLGAFLKSVLTLY